MSDRSVRILLAFVILAVCTFMAYQLMKVAFEMSRLAKFMSEFAK